MVELSHLRRAGSQRTESVRALPQRPNLQSARTLARMNQLMDSGTPSAWRLVEPPPGSVIGFSLAGAGWMVAPGFGPGRKVRTPQGSALGNAQSRRREGKCHRKHTAGRGASLVR